MFSSVWSLHDLASANASACIGACPRWLPTGLGARADDMSRPLISKIPSSSAPTTRNTCTMSSMQTGMLCPLSQPLRASLTMICSSRHLRQPRR